MARNDKKKESTYVKREKPKKEFILLEVDKKSSIEDMCHNGFFREFPVVDYLERYGKLYAKCKNEKAEN